MTFVDIFQDGKWKLAPVVSEYEVSGEEDKIETIVTYIEPVSHKLVTIKKSALPYKYETEAKAIRNSLDNV